MTYRPALLSATLTAATLAAVMLAALPARANDGFGGLSPTGLTFAQTDAVAMESEDLFIGLDRIQVDYVFRNTSDQPVTGEMIFPLPPISIWGLWESPMNLPPEPLPDNLVNFTATVDGTPVPVSIDRVAVIEQPWEQDTPVAQRYDTPGRDVTADLERFGLPLSLNPEEVMAAISALPAATQNEVEALGLAYFDPVAEGQDPATTQRQGYPQWSIVLRYHWTQTFPPGQKVQVHHDYTHYPSGAVFGWEHPADPDYPRDEVTRYCVDEGTSKAMAEAVKSAGDDVHFGMAYYIEYVLRTANSWAGPIGTFRLTLDKGDAKNVLSLCADGVKKTGPTTFVVEKTNYSPDRDLEVLVVIPTQTGE